MIYKITDIDTGGRDSELLSFPHKVSMRQLELEFRTDNEYNRKRYTNFIDWLVEVKGFTRTETQEYIFGDEP